jgi:hypothetical protein
VLAFKVLVRLPGLSILEGAIEVLLKWTPSAALIIRGTVDLVVIELNTGEVQ